MIRSLLACLVLLGSSWSAPARAADPPGHDLTGCAQVALETGSPLLPELATVSFGGLDMLLVPSVDAKGRVSGFADVDGRLLALSGKVAGKGNGQKAKLRAVGVVDGKPNEVWTFKGGGDASALDLTVSGKDKAADVKLAPVALDSLELPAALGRVLLTFDLVQDEQGKLGGTGCADTRDLRIPFSKLSGRVIAVDADTDQVKLKAGGKGAKVGLFGFVVDGIFDGEATGKVGPHTFKDLPVTFEVPKSKEHVVDMGSASLDLELPADGVIAEEQLLTTTTGWQLRIEAGTVLRTRFGVPLAGAVELSFSEDDKPRKVGCPFAAVCVCVTVQDVQLGAPANPVCVFDPPLVLSPPASGFLGGGLELPDIIGVSWDLFVPGETGPGGGLAFGELDTGLGDGLGIGAFDDLGATIFSDSAGIDILCAGNGTFTFASDPHSAPALSDPVTTDLVVPGGAGDEYPKLKKLAVRDRSTGRVVGVYTADQPVLGLGDVGTVVMPAGAPLGELSVTGQGIDRVVRLRSDFRNAWRLVATLCHEDGSESVVDGGDGPGADETAEFEYAGPVTVTVDYKGDALLGALRHMGALDAATDGARVKLLSLKPAGANMTRATLELRGFTGATAALTDALDGDFTCTAGPRTLTCVEVCPQPLLFVTDLSFFRLLGILLQTLFDDEVITLPKRPGSMLTDRAGRRTFVAVGNRVVCIDNELGRVIDTLKVKGEAPQLALSPGGLVLYVVTSSKKGGVFAAYSLVTKELLFAVGGFGTTFLGSLATTSNQAAFPAPFEDMVYRVDLLRRRADTPLSVGGPQACSYSHAGDRLAVTRSSANLLVLFDRAAAVLGQVATGAFPLRPRWTLDDRGVLVPNFNGDTLTYLDATDFDTTFDLDVGDGPNSLHVFHDPDTGREGFLLSHVNDRTLWGGDWDDDGDVDAEDFTTWKQQFDYEPGVVGGSF